MVLKEPLHFSWCLPDICQHLLAPTAHLLQHWSEKFASFFQMACTFLFLCMHRSNFIIFWHFYDFSCLSSFIIYFNISCLTFETVYFKPLQKSKSNYYYFSSVLHPFSFNFFEETPFFFTKFLHLTVYPGLFCV